MRERSIKNSVENLKTTRRRTKSERVYDGQSDITNRELILEMGGTPVNSPLTEFAFALETKAGTLDISLYGHWVAIKFRDLVKAKKVLPDEFALPYPRANRFTGKWNLHWASHLHPLDRKLSLKLHLERAL